MKLIHFPKQKLYCYGMSIHNIITVPFFKNDKWAQSYIFLHNITNAKRWLHNTLTYSKAH
jgi:hypothetical protein